MFVFSAWLVTDVSLKAKQLRRSPHLSPVYETLVHVLEILRPGWEQITSLKEESFAHLVRSAYGQSM